MFVGVIFYMLIVIGFLFLVKLIFWNGFLACGCFGLEFFVAFLKSEVAILDFCGLVFCLFILWII